MEDRSPAMRYRAARAVQEHPRLTLATIVSIATLVGLIGAGVTWVVSFFVFKSDFSAHQKHDESVQAWNQYGFAANRLDYLDDKQAECEARKMITAKLAPVDAAICTRYESKLKAKTSEADDLKKKALDTTKEAKP